MSEETGGVSGVYQCGSQEFDGWWRIECRRPPKTATTALADDTTRDLNDAEIIGGPISVESRTQVAGRIVMRKNSPKHLTNSSQGRDALHNAKQAATPR